jgi:hypothetical protein
VGAGDDLLQDAVLAPVGDDDGGAHAGGFGGGGQLAGHAAGGKDAALALGVREGVGGDAGQEVHPAAAALGVGGMEAVDGGQQHQQVGLDQHGGARGQRIVVAELDFIDGDHVVFVDDGDDAVLEELEHGVAGIEVAAAVFEVVVGQQDLADAAFAAGEELVIGRHEPRLPDGGGHLQGGEIVRLGFHAEGLEAAGDGAGGDDDDLAALAAQGGEAGDEFGHAAQVGPAVALDEHPAADLHDHAPGSRQCFPCRQMGHNHDILPEIRRNGKGRKRRRGVACAVVGISCHGITDDRLP